MKRCMLCLFVLSFLSACAPPMQPARLPAAEPPSPTLTRVSRSTATLSAAITALPGKPPEPTEEPTFVIPPTPTPIPADWQTYTNPGLHISLRYPSGWKAASPTRYAGPDGFFEVSTRFFPRSEFDHTNSVCVLEANTAEAGLYGANPEISGASVASSADNAWQAIGCLVGPEGDQAGASSKPSVLFLRMPAPWQSDQLLELRADSVHMAGLLSTLRIAGAVAPTPSSGVYDAPACAFPPNGPAEKSGHFNGLTIIETAIANQACDPYNQFDGFRARLGAAAAKTSLTYQKGLQALAAEDNQALKPFGYRLESQPGDPPAAYDLYRGNTVLVASVTRLGQVTVNARGNDFILWIQDTFSSKGPIEVRRSSLRELPVLSMDQGFNSLWVGDSVISYAYDAFGQAFQANLAQDGKPIGRIAVPPPGPPGYPIVGFWSWNHHWILEVESVVFQDGKALNQSLGYDEIFDWRLVNGQPFYFYRKGGEYGLVYAGQTLPQRYDDVIHGQLCCDPAVYSILSTINGSRFYARKAGVWYLVTIQI